MRAVIVDDDMLFCEKFHKVLFSFFEQLGWIIEIDIINNVERIVNLEVVYDYYFVDIEMPSIMGFELIEKLRSRYVQAEFIIVSAYEKYMQKAFYLEPTAFIRKCELEADTKRTIQHLYRKMRGEETFCLIDDHKRVQPAKIIYCNSQEHYVYVNYANGEHEIFRKQLDDVEQILCTYDFVRIHRRILVNLRHVKKFESRKIILNDNKELPVSRSKMRQVERIIFNWFEQKSRGHKMESKNKYSNGNYSSL